MSISLPTVITGKNHSVGFPPDVTPVCIPFQGEWGAVSLEIGLVDQPAEVLAGT